MTVAFDTTSIASNSTVNSATISFSAVPNAYGNETCYYKAYSTSNAPPSWMGPNFATPDVVNWVQTSTAYYSNPSFSIPGSTVAKAGSSRYQFQLRCTPGETSTFGGGSWFGGNQGSSINIGSPSLTVDYSYAPVIIFVDTNPTGRAIILDGTNYTAPQWMSWVPNTTHTIAAPTPQSGGTGVQYTLNGWSDSGAASHSITVPTSAANYLAVFAQQYYLTTSAGIGGTIWPASGWYNAGSSASVQATPYIGYPFLSFSGDVNTTANPAGFTMNGPKSVTASFALPTAYSYYYIDTLGGVNGSNWSSNGSISTGGAGMTSTDTSGGTLISSVAIPGGGSLGEVQAVVTLGASGGSYTAYMMASSDAMLGATTRGTYYAADLQNPTYTGSACGATLVLYKVISGSVTSLGSTTVPCRSGMVLRLVKTSTAILAYADGALYFQMGETSISSGKPGIGVRGAPSGNSIAQTQLGPLDTTAPTAVASSAVATSVLPNQVDFHWKGAADNAGGTGISHYCLARSGGPTQCSRTAADLTDATVAAGTTYSYQLQVYDLHGNMASTTISVTTPPSGTTDPRRVGLRSTGAYWGGNGENIDVRSGNLNFTLPLLKAQGRGGWGLAFNLIYNSQNWRQDGSTTWNLGEDVGYGYGWKLMAGSLTPVWGNYAIDHYTFTDSTGAEYRLNVNTGGVWTSTDSIYVNYDSSTSRLYFNDGSFWVMGCVSGGTETDAGAMYPTLVQDTNGNQISILYAAGNGLVWGNSSARIRQIEDVRAYGAGSATYSFNYNTDSIPHLTSITNAIGTSEGYGFTYSGAQTLSSPFGDSTSFDAVNRLTGMSLAGLGLGYTLQADSSGELTQTTFPYGGYLKWTYGPWSYSGSRKQMEVATRVASKDGTTASERTYTLYHSGESNNGTNAVHVRTDLDDPSGKGGRTWYFAQSGATIGFLSSLERYNYNPGRVVAAADSITWTQDPAGRWYIGSSTSSADGTVVKTTAQTLDTYGNVIATQIYAGSPSTQTLVRTYNNTYLTPPTTYMRNRIAQNQVSVDGTIGTRWTVASYGYDGTYGANQLTDLPSVRQHDPAYGTTYTTRGNVTSKADLSGVTTMNYDIGGNVTQTVVNGVTANSTYSSGSNYAVPGAITTGSLIESMQFNSFLGLTQDTGPNGDTASITYDAYARPSVVTSKTGGGTIYMYSSSAPWTVTGISAGRYSRKTLDGYGRTVKVETGTATGGYPSFTYSAPASVVETTYDPCGCSPMGKVSATSMPHANGATAIWTTYTYDGLGRTTRTTLPDGSHKDYAYSVNTATLTDEAGNWKKYTVDALGNLTQVEEPNPAGGSFFTYYTYDLLNHLTGVSMPRPSGTQTRTFNYTGAYLTSATNPETGTVTYSYANGLLMSKTDAKGQQIQYSYDTYHRVTQVRHYPVSGSAEDTCQQVNFTYDSNSVPGFSYLAGRLATRSYSTCAVPFSNTGSTLRTDFVDMYSYTQGGLVAVKRLRVKRGTGQYDLDGSWTYDGEGKMMGVTYPTASSGPAGGSYTIGYNSMGQLNTLTDGSVNILTGQTIYIVSGATYGVAGELTQIQGLYNESRGYSPERLQLTSLNGVTFSYPSNSNNNSKISSQYDPSSGETISYVYDQLNRLISATSSQGWSQGFTYDGFGNLTGKTALVGSVPTFSAAFDPATNRQIGISYDANGNQVTDKAGANLLQYDVENRLVWAQNGNSSPGDWYGYDPDNRRVYLSNWTYSSANTTWNVTGEQIVYYGVGGQKMGTYALFASSSSVTLTATGYNVYFGSKLIRKIDSMGTVTQVSPDRLGSLGKFYPYGEDRPSNPSANNTEKFATYYRDQDTGFDYAMNRYYNSTSGRFTTADPSQANLRQGSPQSWNRYAYGDSDPANHNDPSGLGFWSSVWGGIKDFLMADDAGYDTDLIGGGGSGGGDNGWGGPPPSCSPSTAFAPSPGPYSPECAPYDPLPPAPPPERECQIDVRYSMVAPSIGGTSINTGYNHTMLYMQDNFGFSQVVDGWPVLGTYNPAPLVNIPMLFLRAGASTNGYYNNANSSWTSWASDWSAFNCDLWDGIVEFAEKLSNNSWYGVFTSNSNALTSTLLSGAGFLVPAPPNAPGWGSPIIVLP